jgi:hypothetical protein
MTIFDDPMHKRYGTLDGDPVVYNFWEAWVHGNNGWYEVPAADMWSLLHKIWIVRGSDGGTPYPTLPPLPRRAFAEGDTDELLLAA